MVIDNEMCCCNDDLICALQVNRTVFGVIVVFYLSFIETILQ